MRWSLLTCFLLLLLLTGYATERRITAENTIAIQVSPDLMSGMQHGTFATDGPDFDDLFERVRSIEIRGTSEHPIFNVSRMAMHEGRIALIDQNSHTLTVLNQDGEILYQVGGRGEGPGDLTAPDWVGFDALGRIVVKEWHGNHRVQLFDAEDGATLETFSLKHGSAPTGQAHIEGSANDQRFIFTSGQRCMGAEEKVCVVQEQDFTGEILRHFGVMDEIEPGSSSLPFVMGNDDDGRVYLAHRKGGNVVIYNADRERTGHFHIGDAPGVKLLDMKALPEDVYAAQDVLRNTESTLIRTIYPVGDQIILDHFHRHAEPNNFLTIWTREGDLLASGIGLAHPLRHVQGNRFFFLETDTSSDLGSYLVHEYTYTAL